uniref:Uncharacterized protein n=1 Tax=Eutreptiella gymnastica TaxID=73025 RepID=A0A7S4G2P4_9EUGL
MASCLKGHKLCNACFLCYSGLYMDIPDCIGCSSSSECLCLSHACCLKMGGDHLTLGFNKGGSHICKIGLYVCEWGLLKPRTLCQSQGQYCCQTSGCALPPTKDVPMALAMWFLVCYPKLGICMDMSELGVSNPPGANAMN